MPKMFVHSREGTFTPEARVKVAAALTELGIACERLASRTEVARGVWVFFSEYSPDAVFSGGDVADDSLMALVVNALQGGLDAASKQRLIAEATHILGDHAVVASKPVPAYVVINEIPESNWGMYGASVRLTDLRKET